MNITKKEFLNLPKKAITLIGMSGAGKSHISCQLEAWGWTNYSCDYEIGAKYLKDELENVESMSASDIGALSTYLGKLGGSDYGGFDLETFKLRQKAYYDAECDALNAMQKHIEKNDFVHDSTGSLCEVEDEGLLHKVGEQTLFVYLKTDEQSERDVLKRAQDYPKPLFFPTPFLTEKLDEFLSENDLNGVDEIIPDDFSRWVFPLLFEARKPKYQRLADLYGVTIPASEFLNLRSSDEFIQIISKYIGK